MTNVIPLADGYTPLSFRPSRLQASTGPNFSKFGSFRYVQHVVQQLISPVIQDIRELVLNILDKASHPKWLKISVSDAA